MATFRTIDIEHIIQRREEANGCLAHRFFHAATLTACSGIELLLEFLVTKLYAELKGKGGRRANNLQNDVENEQNKNSAKIKYWGLNSWVVFFKRKKIIEQLQKEFNYSFRFLNTKNLDDINDLWNKCKHDSYLATADDANNSVYFLNEYLIETEINLEADHPQRLAVGDISRHWLGMWDEPLKQWAFANSDALETEVLLSLTSYLDLVIRLIDDKRVNFEHKTALMVAANYVFSSLDLLPENFDKQDARALVDDGAVLALSVSWLLRQDQFDNAIVYDHWPSADSILKEVNDLTQFVTDNHELLFPSSSFAFGNKLTWNVLKRISVEGPETLWQNYWQEKYRPPG